LNDRTVLLFAARPELSHDFYLCDAGESSALGRSYLCTDERRICTREKRIIDPLISRDFLTKLANL